MVNEVKRLTAKVYGRDGHRQRAAFFPTRSFIVNRDGHRVNCTLNTAEVTGSYEFVELVLSSVDASYDNLDAELWAQISDGVLEDCYVGNVEERIV